MPAQHVLIENETLYEDFIAHYLYRLQEISVEGNPLIKALHQHIFISVLPKKGNENETERNTECLDPIIRNYIKLFRHTTIPEAKKLSGHFGSSTLRTILAIDSDDHLNACSAILLFASRHEELSPKLFPEEHNTPEFKQDIKDAKGKIFAQIRFHLAHCKELKFISLAMLPQTSGHGSAIIGNYGYSHFGREIVFFAMLESILGKGFLDQCERHLPLEAFAKKPIPFKKNNISLIDTVLLQLAGDLKQIAGRSKYQDRNTAFNDNIDNTSASIGAKKPSEYKKSEIQEIENLKVEIEYLNKQPISSLNEKKRDYIIKKILDKEQKIRDLDYLIDAQRQSKPLFEADNDFIKLRDNLDKLITLVEASDRQHKGGDFSSILRLRFAFRLLTHFNEKKYSATKDRKSIYDDLGKIFAPLFDPSTGNALQWFSNDEGKGKEIWGQGFNKVMDHFIEIVIPKTREKENQKNTQTKSINDAREFHKELTKTLSSNGQVKETPEVGSKYWEIRLYLWAMEHIERYTTIIDDPSIDTDKELAIQFIQLKALIELLHYQFFMIKPQHYLKQASNYRNQFCRNKKKSKDDDIKRLERLDSILNIKLTIDGEHQKIHADGRDKNGPPERDKKNSKQLSSDDIMRAELRDFFTRKWAKGQGVGYRERWEYLAYSLCISGTLPKYQSIYHRLLDHLRAHLTRYDRYLTYELCLVAVRTADDILCNGNSLIVIALVGTLDREIHIRIFDTAGEKVVDTPQDKLKNVEALTTLKKRLHGAPGEHRPLSHADIYDLKECALSCAGLSPLASTARIRQLYKPLLAQADFSETLEKTVLSYLVDTGTPS